MDQLLLIRREMGDAPAFVDKIVTRLQLVGHKTEPVHEGCVGLESQKTAYPERYDL